MTVTAKICGLSTADTLDAALRHGASHVGFVFFPPSPRHLSPAAAAGLSARVSGATIVGVFVDPDEASVRDAVAAAGLGAIQLHRTAPDKVARLRQVAGVEAWAAVAVRTRGDLESAVAYRGAADRLLYDAKTPDGAALPGGMGLRFDWALLDGFDHPLPWALSGGLDAGNVAAAARRTGASLVDVSSGVENAPGVKDAGKIAAFLKAVEKA
ncbi:N-(5'-phosphoribosyl)anthranilate isomerase [Sphingomonas sp. Leaf412]|uniref:phosphoribosylanthranilate isomerase n=1 Tax=Sphingomonas sp. Leaf412 TaxID=1736370 RepID=UPI0006F50EC0|nr:phosphoribosylanthranilate isomerase [Sphingomonas sp. Leaf412]KQT32439.1 N-(5'-phosphoribosyl)anthranilate isomerase [Sphingomonas sp. Leaf412]